MANSPSSKKRARQSVDRRSRNASQRSLVRTMIKKVVSAIETKDIKAAENAYNMAVPVIDRMGK